MHNFQIREAKQDDAPSMAKVRVETWRSAYKGIVPDQFLDSLSHDDISERWKRVFWQDRDPATAVFVAENGVGEIVGIAICGMEQNHDPVYRGEIYVLYVLPQNQNRGIGRELVAACVRHFIDKLRVRTMLIWVLAENPYRRFYESLGGRKVHEKTQEIGGKLLAEIGYGWDEINNLR